MAHGIQHVQTTQFFELPSSSARGAPELRNIKWLNSNLTCGTSIGGRSEGRKHIEMNRITFRTSLFIGLSQALAIIPGVSRSEITMTMGLLMGLTREGAARFSFL